jgi:ribonucleoside-diphosphate reductase alpha chain
MATFEQDSEMFVQKRNGQKEIVSFDKILTRIKNIGQEAGIQINYTTLVIKVIDQLYDGISTTKIDDLLAEQCASLASTHPDYNVLAGRIAVSSHHKNTPGSFLQVVTQLHNHLDKHEKPSPILTKEFHDFVTENAEKLESYMDYSRDFLIDYFGFKTLERAYMLKSNKVILERPQDMWMRVSVAIHMDVKETSRKESTLSKIKETYDLMSNKYFTHATPTLFNAGTMKPQLSSCFLLAMEQDSMEGIYNTLKDCAMISKWAGGIGLHIHNIRAKGSDIRGTNGQSSGLVPMLRVFNNTAKFVDQGGKRNGSFAIYLEPWHADIEAFLQMRKNHGDEELKARDLFYALWIPDLFMERIKADGDWTLMCPDECPGLADVYGDAFVELYTRYESEGRGRITMKARNLWFQVLDAQMETGTPYLLYKDACNKKSNQKNLGTIKSSNLCVAGETLILTEKGHIPISELSGQKTNVWNGTEYSEVEVFQTGEDQELVNVETDDGTSLTCTPYHKFFIQNSYNKKDCRLVEAKDLKPGDRLKKCNYPVISGDKKMKYAYTHGFFCGDGTYSNNHLEHKQCEFKSLSDHYFCKRHLDFETEFSLKSIQMDVNTSTTQCNAMSYVKKPVAYLYGDKKELLKHIDYRYKTENETRINLQLPLDIDEKFYVPFDASLQDKMEWFSGYCDADGTIANNGENQQLQMASINRDFLLNLKLMLQTCGINPKLKHARSAGHSYLPDGKGGHKLFDTKELYRLLITSCDLLKLVSIGFSPHRLKINSNQPQRNAIQFIKISSVSQLDRRDNTFCFNEPKCHAGIFNGILTSQCSEIVQYSDENESAVCNLASIALPTFVKPNKQGINEFDFQMLHSVSKIVTYNLNRVIEVNYYPTEKTERSNRRHRPIGIGIQGLADVFFLMGLPFASEEARDLNRQIFETIYHGAVEESMELSKMEGPYETFQGSPASKGELQFDLWSVDPGESRYDWTKLKPDVVKYGLRNSLLLAPMPTASTSQILGFNECIEPITSNIYSRRTLAGEFILANKYLMTDLIKLDLWNEKIKNNIIANHGSIQQIDVIPQHIKEKYKTVWEIPMRALIDMAADRGAYVCQSQSLNLWLEDPNYNMLTSMHFYGWSKGLKTGIYYLRRRGRHQAQQFTIEPEKATGEKNLGEGNEICEMCSA